MSMPDMVTIPSGQIDLDSEFGRAIGFTSDHFEGYGWVINGAFWVSCIVSKEPGKGHFRKLVDRALDLGLTVKIPTPFPRMREICQRYGFQETIEDIGWGETCQVMVKQPHVAP